MKKILYVGWCMPYDTVAHAGGQIFNYYIKEMSKDADIKLITIALPGEKKNATIEKYGVDTRYIEFDKLPVLEKVKSINSKINPWHKYGGIVTQYKVNEFVYEARQLSCEGYNPDVVVLQWTQVILMIDEFKKIFPNSKFIGVEEDVTFLRLKREYDVANRFNSMYKYAVYKNEKKRELLALSKCNTVYTNNHKDEKLLISNGFDQNKLKVLVPYYHIYNSPRSTSSDNRDILFYGNMGRPENYNAAIDFIENVFPKIKTDRTRFIVMGGNAEHLKKYESDCIIVTGYVKNPDEYFAKSALFVAPITQGAGIKIKVLEAMSSGIPVITTDVGIEGIPAKDGRDFLLYDSHEQLLKNIDLIFNNYSIAVAIGNNGRKVVSDNFNYAKSVEEYKSVVLS